MIGDGWDGQPSLRPTPLDPPLQGVRRVAVVTGTRAEFGLLRPVMAAIADRADLELCVVAAGAHLIPPGESYREVKAAFPIAEIVPMQVAGRTGRLEDAQSLGRGIERFARAFERLRPDWVVVLGDRIEAFAAASAAAVGGIALAHVHGGDRAEGVADESMRHAISKLAHLHLAATPASAERLIRMGERPERVHVTGSPALDDLPLYPALDDAAFAELGRPTAVLLMHPVGRLAEVEEAAAAAALEALEGERVLALHPNHDPGREGTRRAMEHAAASITLRTHLPRATFVGVLKRLAAPAPAPAPGGVLVGNSSAALIEAAALRLPAVDIGPRQAGRERPPNVIHASFETPAAIREAIAAARALDRSALTHPYGDGRAAVRIAAHLASTPPHDSALLRKRCAY
jgi:UDP-hydrolysing UDP-N-acetyl-D-glucosamine 2-epimerase